MGRANARLYQEAARQIAEGEAKFSCSVLSLLDPTCRLKHKYSRLFTLEGTIPSNVIDLWKDSDENQQNRRVLMLCLASAIEFEGKP